MTIEEKRKQYEGLSAEQRERYEAVEAAVIGAKRAFRRMMFFMALASLGSISALAIEVWRLISRAQ